MAWLDRPGLAWAGLALALALGSVLCWWWLPWPLDWQPGLAGSQPWRAWTAAFVHWNASHLAANLGACLLLGLLGWRVALPAQAALAWLMAWPLTHLGLVGLPVAPHYGGLSGVLHAGAVVLAGMLIATPGAVRRLGLALLAGLALKLAWEAAGGSTAAVGPGPRVEPLAHVSGAVAGLLALCAVLLLGRRRWRADFGHASAQPVMPGVAVPVPAQTDGADLSGYPCSHNRMKPKSMG